MTFPRGPKRLTALVVDDDRATREMYSLFLSTEGVNTVAAEDGLQGLAKAAAMLPDVITTDLQLPRMNGVTFCRSLKQREHTRRIPVIAVTDSATPTEIEAARQAGCVSILLKPCRPELLLEEIKRVLAVRHVSGETAPAAGRLQNRLVAALPREEYQRLMPEFKHRPMTSKQVLQRAGERVAQVLFPQRGICSNIKIMDDGATIEAAMIGPEGMIGVGAVYGDATVFGDVVARTPGSIYALDLEIFRREMAQRGPFHDVIAQYCQSFIGIVAQSAACNGLHSAFQRCSRWLLASSCRLQTDEISLTHEMTAMMLGLRRPTVTLTFKQLVEDQLIWQNRGKVRIVNRPGLEAAACECYTIEKGFCSKNLSLPLPVPPACREALGPHFSTV